VAADGLRSLRSSGKRVGVLGSGRVTNEEAFLAVRVARDALGTPHLDASLRSPYEALLSGVQPQGGRLDQEGILKFVEESGVILLLEDDLARSHPQVAFLIMRAVQRGARLVTLAPARTQMSALARAHLFLDPAGDPEGPPELERALGDAAGTEAVALVLAPFTSDEARLRATAAALYRRLDHWAGGWGPVVRVLPLPLMANTRGAFEMGLGPGILPGSRSVGDPAARRRLMEAWGPEVRTETGMGAERILDESDGLVLIRENPPETQPSPSESLRALEGKEFLVVLDAFRSPAVERASVALPLAAFSETPGTLVSLDGLIQRWRPAVPLPGGAREGWQALVDLLTALGVRTSYRSLADVATEIGRVVPEYGGGLLEERGTPWSRRVKELCLPGDGASPLSRSRAEVVPDASGAPFRIALVGTHGWGDDLAVGFSPTLRRDGVSLRKRFPGGRVFMSRGDAEKLGLRDGWRVGLRSRKGVIDVPVSLSGEVEPGVLMAPFGFRDQFGGVLGGAVEGMVTLERR
jgi:predicted molibdopterin-dependent oxidoreductase YjgC